MNDRKIVLGLGAGQCGLTLLAEVLGKQAGAKVSFHEPPLLPWNRRPEVPGMRERIRRWQASRREPFIGDVASFYLPYVEEAIECDSGIRLVCLRRPSAEITANFCGHLDKVCPFPTNHWAKSPAPGWYHDPVWSQTFPQYDVQDRIEGLQRYWEEYYSRSDALVDRFPENFRVFDADLLTTESGLREILEFAGILSAAQVGTPGIKKKNAELLPANAAAPPPRYPHPLDPRKCVVLVPYTGFIHQPCEQGLKELERRGYTVRRVAGFSAIDQGRNQLATDALLDGFEETLWIDSDIGFNPDDVEKLRGCGLPIVCGLYPQKGRRALASHVGFNVPRLTFGLEGGLTDILYAGAGFLLVQRSVYLAIQEAMQLPVCNELFGRPSIPFFQPLIRTLDDGHWYLAEDYAFCERARRCGYKIVADTTIRLWHIGTFQYSWEDAGMDRPRFGKFTLNFGEQRDRHASPAMAEALANFAANYPWPEARPQVPVPPDRNWLFPGTRKFLTETISKDAGLIIEVGSWLGRSTRFIADLAPKAKIVAIDHWRGSPEHQPDPELALLLPVLFETFLAESWDYRDRIIPVRELSIDGLEKAADAGLQPDVVYIDGDHSTESVRADLTVALDRFPQARIVGDDWNWRTVSQAVEEVARQRGLTIEVFETAWRIMPKRRE